MATKWYFRSTIFADLSDYPQTNQHTLTPTSGKTSDAFDVTREFQTTLGSGNLTKTITSNATTSLQTFYYGRWMTPRLNLGVGISANTWTLVLAGLNINANGNFPVSGSNKTVPINCYVWRDGVGKVGTIKQGSSIADWDEPPVANCTFGGTFAGNAVGSLHDGDRIVYEIWFQIQQSASSNYDDSFYCNGVNEAPLPYGSTVVGDPGSTTGSYISTPQTITEWSPPANLSMDSVTKDLNSKFITTIV